jgi:hypothetical protein
VADHSHERVHIAAPVTDCFAVATDFEGYPEWADGVQDARIVARDDAGTPRRVEYHVAAMGKSLRYVLEYDLADGPRVFSWRLVEGDMLRRLEGRYAFDDVDGGTDVTYELAVDLTLPMPGILKRRAAGRIVDAALGDLKRTVEARVAGGADDVSNAEQEGSQPPVPGPGDEPAPARDADAEADAEPDPGAEAGADAPGAASSPGGPGADEGVRFDDVGRERRTLPAPGAIELVVSELLGAVPEVRDHLLAAADELLDAARALLEAADRVVRQERDGRTRDGGP